MVKRGLFHRVILGCKKKPFKVFVSTFIAYAAIWTLLDPLLSMVSSAQKYFSGELKFFILVLVSSLIGLGKTALPGEITLQYANSTIKVVFDDLFASDGFKVVPVSRYFHEIEVIPTSLQNKIIQMFVQSAEGSKGSEAYEKSLSSALQSTKYEEIYRPATNREEKYYPLGTTIPLGLNGDDYLLFALTDTELKGYIPHDNCSVSKMWVALEIFWQNARIHSRGSSLNIPLIGSGVTGIRLNQNQILELNLLSIANAIEEGGKITTEEIRIVLHSKYMEIIDLNDFQDLWK
ncbi:hypothetical protein NIES2104_50910 [Leptolyngbya sp. NIES-2104]|nr:hypothetical protein NIES2104_50910 [Leptolyngbya sp. NIES-2104]